MTVQQVIQVTPMVQIVTSTAALGTACFTAWISWRKTLLAERARNIRLSTALSDARSRKRAEIVRACAVLESAARNQVCAAGQRVAARPAPGDT